MGLHPSPNDAAPGFLRKDCVGASMAMESTAVLADDLSRTDVVGLTIRHALGLCVRRRRRNRIESIQDDSRKLARMISVKSRPSRRSATCRALYSVEVSRVTWRAHDALI